MFFLYGCDMDEPIQKPHYREFCQEGVVFWEMRNGETVYGGQKLVNGDFMGRATVETCKEEKR